MTTKPTLDLPPRFALKARGAGMEIVDTRTKRAARVRKSDLPAVCEVLRGLFAKPDDDARPSWTDALPQRHVDRDLGLSLRLTTVNVNPEHPSIVLDGRSRAKGQAIPAYSVSIDGKPVGHVLAAAENRFVIAAPEIQADRTNHRGFEPALLRVEILARNYRERVSTQSPSDT